MRSLLISFIILVLAASAIAEVGDVWNTKLQWSNVYNPRTLTSAPYGTWSYHHGTEGSLLVRATSPYTIGWSVDGTNNVPNLYGSSISSVQQYDEFGGHGPWAVAWESPVDGYISISGSMLQLYEVDRRMKYELRCNGSTFAEGFVPEDASGNTITVYHTEPTGTRNGLVEFGPIIVWVNKGEVISYHALGASTDEGGNGVATSVVSSFVLEQVNDVVTDRDAKADWSDVSNPNGLWSYHDASDGDLMLAASSGVGGSPGGWSHDGSNATPPNLFDDIWGAVQQSNEFGGHGPWLVRWTSPYTGLVRVNGSLLQLYEISRRMKYQLLKNGAVITEGLVLEDVSGNTITAYDSGPANRDGLVEFGPIDIAVDTGDEIDFAAVAGSTAEGGNGEVTFVYGSFHIEPLGFSPPESALPGDINRDNTVDFSDLAEFALRWLEVGCDLPGSCGRSDIDFSGQVDYGDFSYISANWLDTLRYYHNLGYVVVSPDGPGDGSDFGPSTPGTQTAGWQEAIDYAVANNKDIFVVGGGHKEWVSTGGDVHSGQGYWVGPVLYFPTTTIYIPPAENLRITGGDYVLAFSNSDADCIVVDSQKNCDFDLGCIVAGNVQDGVAIIKVKPQTARPDGQIGFSNCSVLVNFLVGHGSVWGENIPGQGTAWLFDGTDGPIENSRFTVMEINASGTGFLLEAGDIRNNIFECPFNHITNNMLVVNSGTYNKFDIMLNPGGVGGSVIGANIAGGQQNVYTLSFNGWGSETAIIWGEGDNIDEPTDNLVYAMSLPMSQVVNDIWDLTGTNKIVTLGTVGNSVATPGVPPSGVLIENRTSLPVIATIESPGVVSSWVHHVGGSSGGDITINAGLRSGQEIYLEPGDYVLFDYASAPSWNWRAVR